MQSVTVIAMEHTGTPPGCGVPRDTGAMSNIHFHTRTATLQNADNSLTYHEFCSVRCVGVIVSQHFAWTFALWNISSIFHSLPLLKRKKLASDISLESGLGLGLGLEVKLASSFTFKYCEPGICPKENVHEGNVLTFLYPSWWCPSVVLLTQQAAVFSTDCSHFICKSQWLEV